jgi:cobalt-zinc-cadmium efflux system outer membrane protein
MKDKWILFFLLLFIPAILHPGEKTEFTLSEIISLGLKQNPLISAKRREAEAKKSAYQASKRLFNPQLEFHRGRAKSHDGLVERNTEGISLSQYIENPFKRHHRIQAYEKDWESVEFQYDFWVLDITFEIKELFFTILLLEKKEGLTQKNFDSITEIHALIEKRAALGEVKELEAIKLYVETLKAHNELKRIQTRLELARENLNTYLGNSLPPDFSVVGSLEYTPLDIQGQSLVEKALRSHPRIREKEALLDRAKSNLTYLRWQRLPDFALTGFSQKELDGTNTGIGISLDIPLWNFRSNEIAEAESLYLNLAAEIKSALKHLKLSEQTLNTYHAGLLKQAEESLKISQVSYTQGEISLIDYLDSQRTYYSILNDYQDSLYTWNADKAALEKDIGEKLK